MLATARQVSSDLIYLARRTAGLSLMMAGEFGAALFPSLLMSRDRIAFEAWATGYLASEAPSAPDPSPGRAVR